MSLEHFLTQIFNGDPISINKHWPIDWGLIEEGEALLVCQEAYETDKLEFPGTPPPFCDASALWAAKKLYAIAQLYLNRNLGIEETRETLTQDYPRASDPTGYQYSVDICLRFVPSIYALGATLAPEDPYLESLSVFMSEWPLSSIGMPAVAGETVHSKIPQGLARLYAERCIQKQDYQRLKSVIKQEHTRGLIESQTKYIENFPQDLFQTSE